MLVLKKNDTSHKPVTTVGADADTNTPTGHIPTLGDKLYL